MNRLSATKDGYRLLVQVHNEKGKLLTERLYLDRRVGVTWPSLHTPGYFCIMGLYDEPEPRRLRLLREYETGDRTELVRKLAVASQQLGAHWLLADLGPDYAPYERAFLNHCRARNIRGLQLIDVADISGFIRARPTIDDLSKRRLIRMPRSSILYGQGLTMSPDNISTQDGIRPEQLWYAVNALGHVVCSYDHWPWRNPKKEKARANPGSRAGYG